MKICRFSLKDSGEISKLIKETIKRTNYKDLTKEQLKAWLQHYTKKEVNKLIGKVDFFILKKDSKILGVIFFQKNFIKGLYVNANCLGKGYGKTLLEFAEMKISKLGYNKAILNSSKTAFNFYKKQNYKFIRMAYSKLFGVNFQEYRMEKKLSLK